MRLAQLPAPIDQGPGPLPGGASLVVKRDDLTGLGRGGNKARKLEPLCATALAQGCDVLVTVSGAQSNHCRIRRPPAPGSDCLCIWSSAATGRPRVGSSLAISC